MFKKFLLFWFSLCLAPVFASPNPCVANLDSRIATLYACNLGEKFLVLSLDRCNLIDKDMPAVARWLKAHPHVTALDLSQNQLSDKGMTALSTNQTLEWISVSYNYQISSVGIIALANISSLRHLNATSNRIDAIGASALAGLTHLTSLDLGMNLAGTAGAQSLAHSTSLRILYLDDNQIGDEGAAAFANNTSLHELYIAENQLGDASATALATNPRLTDLGLDYNHIGDVGAIALAKNSTLRWLYLHNNQIGPTGIAALLANTTLIKVTTQNNKGARRRASLTYSKQICYN